MVNRKTDKTKEVEALSSRIAERQRRIKEIERMRREASREMRGIKKKLTTALATSADYQHKVKGIREEVSAFLYDAARDLKLRGYHPTYTVSINKDQTVDAEFRVPYPTSVKTFDQAVNVLSAIELTLDRVPHVQHISVGFTLAPEVNAEGVRATALQYVKYEGELRLNPNYEDTGRGLPYSFQTAYTVLRNVEARHGRLPTGMLIRMAWSYDGELHRKNDHELRTKISHRKRKTKKEDED